MNLKLFMIIQVVVTVVLTTSVCVIFDGCRIVG